MVSRGEHRGGTGGGGVRKLVWLAEQLFTSLSFSLSPPLFLAPSLYSALYSAEMTGGKLYCSEFVSIGAPLRGEAGGRAERALSQRPRLPAPPPPLHSILPTSPPPLPLLLPLPPKAFSSSLALKFKFKALILKG